MVANFYRRYSRLILGIVGATFFPLWFISDRIRSNNDIETWLPRNTDVRQQYEDFKQDFGAEEVIVVGLPKSECNSQLIEAFAGRLDRLVSIRSCWTPARMIARMNEFGVEEEDAVRRLDGLLQSQSGELIGVVATLSEKGVSDRAQAVADVRNALEYCQFDSEKVVLTGPPVIVTELDRLGSQKSNRSFFLLTCAISLGLLYYSFGDFLLSLTVLGTTLWGIFLNQTVLMVCGGEMNFILGSLSVMVMIFTLSISVHVVSYYSSAKQQGKPDPIAYAVIESLNPCLLSTLTTLLGLISLNVSSILPVSQFGYAAAAGSIVALIVGLGVTPALLTVVPHRVKHSTTFRFDFSRWGDTVAHRRWRMIGLGVIGIGITGIGLSRLRSDIDPTEFLPRNSKILKDLRQVERDLTDVDTLEVVVDFHGQRLPFLDQLQKVREIQAKITAHPGIRHALSLSTFFPEEMPESAIATARMLGLAQSYSGEDGLVADRQRLWRISARVLHNEHHSPIVTMQELNESLQSYKDMISFTGLTPLLKNAQLEIFDGFWKSFTAACLTISLVMILSLRSVTAGIIAMIPNIVPIWLVFGSVGFLGVPVDIGMMMTGSIALGISVDCTFHFLVQYQQAYGRGESSASACKRALEHSGEPMLDSTLISSLGLMALCLSSFTPTSRFGMLMAAQMVASLLGELVLLPAILCCRPDFRSRDKAAPKPEPVVNDTSTTVEPEPQIHPFPVEEKPESEVRPSRRIKRVTDRSRTA